MGKVLVIIVTYNGEKWIAKVLDNLLNFPDNISILCIDNCSSDQTVFLIEKFLNASPLGRIRLIKLNKNLGFGKANNIGLFFALRFGYNYICLLNQDAWFIKGSPNDLLHLCNKYPNYGIISPIHFDGDGSHLDDLFFGYINKSQEFLLDCFSFRLKELYTISFVNAAAWFMPIDIVRVVGGFDPMFIHYGEDNDFIVRMKYHGFLCGVTPKVYISHDRKCDIKTLKSFYRIYGYYLYLLKRIDWTYKYAVAFVFKDLFDKITSAFLFREFDMLKKYLFIFLRLFSNLNKIKKSRIYSLKANLPYLSLNVLMSRLGQLDRDKSISLSLDDSLFIKCS